MRFARCHSLASRDPFSQSSVVRSDRLMSIVLAWQESYDRVCAEPIQKVSNDLGLSDVGLANVSRRYGIPVPPRGYLAKRQAGHSPRKAPLPSQPPEGYSDKIQF